MNPSYRTIINIAVCVAVFVTFMGIFGALGIALLVIGIFWAFQFAFTSMWWLSLIIMIALLAVYVVGLVMALEFIERKQYS